MIFFFKDKYLVSAKKCPYISKEQIKQHNSVVNEVEQLAKEENKLRSEAEKTSNMVSIAVGLSLVGMFYYHLLTHSWQDKIFSGLIELSIPASMIFTYAYVIVNAILDSSINRRHDLRELEQTIKEKKAYLDGELSKFKELEKKYAKYWLNLSGYQFEKEVAKLYEAHGYDVQVTKGSGDGGIDIFLEKAGRRYGVQCKNHHKAIGPAAIRDLYGAMSHEGLDAGIFIASSGYTKGAKEFARNKAITLLDINNVLRMHAATLTE
jgi:restriction endonuclease family protein